MRPSIRITVAAVLCISATAASTAPQTPLSTGWEVAGSPKTPRLFMPGAKADIRRRAPPGTTWTPEARLRHLTWCTRHYRSYRPVDNTYQPYRWRPDIRRQCRSPFTPPGIVGPG